MTRGDLAPAGKIVANLLLAAGELTPEELERANAALQAIGQRPIETTDVVAETPEAMAPAIPAELRAGLLELLYVLAGDEPIRRRIADAYAGLWHDESEPPAPPRTGSPVVRWLIGKLPQHQIGRTTEADDVVQQSPYRGEAPAPQVKPVERSPLRQRVEQIHDEYLRVVAAVEQ